MNLVKENILRQIDEILELVEAQIPANPASKKNQELAKQTEEFLAAYFNAMDKAFPYYQLEAIYNEFVKVKEELK